MKIFVLRVSKAELQISIQVPYIPAVGGVNEYQVTRQIKRIGNLD